MVDLKISEVILRERQKNKLTQEELASKLGVSAQAVSNWERGGYPDIVLLPQIANFLHINRLSQHIMIAQLERLKQMNRRNVVIITKNGCMVVLSFKERRRRIFHQSGCTIRL